MALQRNLLIFGFLLFPFAAGAQVAAGDLPQSTIWYLHANLEQMRDSSSGRELYKWLDGEIFMEIHDEVGIDINKETDAITAFSDRDQGTVIVVKGNISKDMQQKLLAIAVLEAKLDTLEYKDQTYYHVYGHRRSAAEEDDEESAEDEADAADDMFEDLEDSAYFSFATPSKLIITASEKRMEAMLDNHGKIIGSSDHKGALFILTADRTFVQAGLRTDRLKDSDDDWESNIIRNTEQAALLVSGHDDLIAVEAQLVSSNPKIAESIGGIVNGLISLQAFNSDLDPKIRSLIQNTRVEVNDNVLSVNTVVDPGLVLTVLNNDRSMAE